MEQNIKQDKKRKRPSIPESVKRELWIKSGGRCEFKGCNKYLYKDNVTKQPRNLANIAHIVSWTEDGPRGNKDSERLSTDISNLMLLCSEHNNLIDDKKYETEYPVELLKEYKKEHEDRIYRVTEMGQDYGVRIIKMYSKIQNQVPTISERSILEAIKPYYPLEESINIDLCRIDDLESAKRQIDKIIDLHVLSDKKEECYNLFIMSKIPLSCYLGYVIGNKVKTEVFQYFRDTQDWKWKEDNSAGHFLVSKPFNVEIQENVNLLIEVSGIFDRNLIPNYVEYVLKAEKPGFYFLQTKNQLIEFQIKFRELLSEIRNIHGENITIHLFIAAPNPISFEIGRSVMKNIDPTIVLYDKVESKIEYTSVMTLHNRIRND